MKLNRSQILGGLAGISLATTGLLEVHKGATYEMLAQDYKISDNKTYEYYQREAMIHGLYLGFPFAFGGEAISLVYLLKPSANKKKFIQ